MGRAINEPGEDVATSRDSLPLASWSLRELEMVLDFEDSAIVLSKKTFLFFFRFLTLLGKAHKLMRPTIWLPAPSVRTSIQRDLDSQ